MVVNLVEPVHTNHVPLKCSEARLFNDIDGALAKRSGAMPALVLAGFLHLYPASVIYAFQRPSRAVNEAFQFTWGTHAVTAAVLCLAPGRVWVSALIRNSYIDMLVHGVSPHETATLVVQTATLFMTAVCTFWVMGRMISNTPGAREMTTEAYLLSAILCITVACFLLNFDFEVVALVYGLTTLGLAGLQLILSRLPSDTK
eukprot:1092894-Rhodomonas_salina.1